MSLEPFRVRLTFHGDLNFFIKQVAEGGEVVRQLNEPTSVKDAIESCGVPHPEVDQIWVDGAAVDFTYVLGKNSALAIYPVGFKSIGESTKHLQNPHADRFLADGHLGKLSRLLRLLGFDVSYHNQWDDRQLLQVMQAEHRALLTRDRRLLMHSVVQDGYCPRSHDATEQTIEVIQRFQLSGHFNPFTRCLQCNAALEGIDKAAVIDQLEPLTRVYYDEFRTCKGCGKIFWRGSHFSKLTALVERFRQISGPPAR